MELKVGRLWKNKPFHDVDIQAPAGNSSAYLVPTEGITIISDIDDILRVTKIYQPEQGLNNTFVNNFTAWMDMPDVYALWQKVNPGIQ